MVLNKMPIQVLMADENQLQIEGLKKLFECVEDIKVYFCQKNDQSILNLINELQPELVILELNTPIYNGIQMIRQIRECYSFVKVIVLSHLRNVEAIQLSLEAGAAGYLLKQSTFYDLVSAIRAVNDGNSFFHPIVAKQILSGIYSPTHRLTDRVDLEQPLTDREIEILVLIAEGFTNDVIAKRLYISKKTVQTHRRNIMDKLGFHDRVELVKYAIRKGIVTLHD